MTSLIKKIISPTHQEIHGMRNRLHKVYRSVLVQAVVEGIIENVLEYSGYECCRRILSQFGAQVCRVVGKSVGYAVGVSPVGLAIAMLVRCPSALSTRSWFVVTSLAVTSSAVLLTVAPDRMEIYGAIAGEVLGNFLGGIFGGFVAIKLWGSEESLIPLGALSSYPIKSIQTILVDHIVPTPALPFIGQIIVDQFKGCLAFNAMDIGSGLWKLGRGKALVGLLPNREKIESLIEKLPVVQQSMWKRGHRLVWKFVEFIRTDDELMKLAEKSGILKGRASQIEVEQFQQAILAKIEEKFHLSPDRRRVYLRIANVPAAVQYRTKILEQIDAYIVENEELYLGLDLFGKKRRRILLQLERSTGPALGYYLWVNLQRMGVLTGQEVRLTERELLDYYNLANRFFHFYYSEVLRIVPKRLANISQPIVTYQIERGGLAG